jgi:hypothetical protein
LSFVMLLLSLLYFPTPLPPFLPSFVSFHSFLVPW